MAEKNLDHHLKEDQTLKVLRFPQRRDQRESNQEAYFAGIIDGEGYISYEKTKKHYSIPSISVEMTDKDVIEKIYNYLSARRKDKIDQVLKNYCEDANAREKYRKLEGVLKNVVTSN